jgi:hypothetical protein
MDVYSDLEVHANAPYKNSFIEGRIMGFKRAILQ